MRAVPAEAQPPASATDGDRQRARAVEVARAAERLAARRGVTLPAHLRLWTLAGGRPAGTAELSVGGELGLRGDSPEPESVRFRRGRGGHWPDDGGGGLAEALEAATSAEQRRSTGLHVTPNWLADHLVALGLDGSVASGRGGGIVADTASTATALAEGPAVAEGGRIVAGEGSTAAARNHPMVVSRGRSRPGRPATVCDPACGGGVFLVAAAKAMRRLGVGRAQVVRELLWGADIDPVGLAACEAALAIWSRGEVPPPERLVVGDPLRDGVGIWPDRPTAGFGLVVGNPPFQNQLGRVTARPRAVRDRLRARFGDVVRAYTDTAWLFLLLACELAEPGGRAVLVQPESVMAARDAAAVRAAVDRRARIVDLWVDDRQVFAARVRVCAPVLELDDGAATAGIRLAGSADGDGDGDGAASSQSHRENEMAGSRPSQRRREEAAAGSGSPARRGGWHDLLADATGIPRVVLDETAGRLGDRATFVAGFRDEYYGVAALVCEADAPTGPDSLAPLITAGAIDWARSAWGRRPVRFAKRQWAAPAVDLARLHMTGSPAARRWVARTLVPKIVVATQTNVLEAAVDEHGAWVPSVPVIAVVPERRDDLWLLAAALASPAATVWLARRTPGVGLHRGALKVSRRDLAELPLPRSRQAWEDAAAALQDLAIATDPAADPEALDRFVASAAAAYGAEPVLAEWWRQRLGPYALTSGVVGGPVLPCPHCHGNIPLRGASHVERTGALPSDVADTVMCPYCGNVVDVDPTAIRRPAT